MTWTLLGNNWWYVSRSALQYSVFHSVSLPMWRPQRSMSDKLIRSFWIPGLAARTVASRWAGRGRADHLLFILMTGCQVPRWGATVPVVLLGLGSKEAAPRPGRRRPFGVRDASKGTLSPILLHLLQRVDDPGNMLTWPGHFRVHRSANPHCS